MNTRIQVEHPVTELVYGVDLVREQLRIAAGERDAGPAALARAARAGRSSAGSPARIRRTDSFPPPDASSTCACPAVPACAGTAASRAGDEVTLFYDSLLAKLIVWAPDRAAGDRPHGARARRAGGRGRRDQPGLPSPADGRPGSSATATSTSSSSTGAPISPRRRSPTARRSISRSPRRSPKTRRASLRRPSVSDGDSRQRHLARPREARGAAVTRGPHPPTGRRW